MEHLQHLVIRQQGRFYHGTCLRCGFRVATIDEPVLVRILQSHNCRKAAPHPAQRPFSPPVRKVD